MYLNDGAQITNTPSGIRAAYNTLTFVPSSQSAAYRRIPRTYVDSHGQTQEWKSWSPPNLVHVPGGTYASTPNATGAYYYKNTVFADDLRPTVSQRPTDNSRIPPTDKPAPMR